LIDWPALVECYPGGVLAVGTSGCIVLANATIARQTAYPVGELVGAPFDRIMPPTAILRRRNGAELARPSLAIVDYVKQGVLGTERDYGSAVVPLLRKDGVHQEVAFEIFFFGVGTDRVALIVTHERTSPSSNDEATQRERSNVERLHQIIFDSAPIGIFHFDTRGVITATNAGFEAIIGSKKAFLLGLDMRTLPDENIVRCVNEALDGRTAEFRGKYRAVTSGKVTPVLARFAPAYDDAGKVVGGVGLIQDFTEHDKAERMVAYAERMTSLGTLAAGTVHEVQNPLAFLIASLDLAARQLAEIEAGSRLPAERFAELRTSMQSAREGAVRVANIARDLRTFASADEELRTSVDVEKALESAIKLVHSKIVKKAVLDRRYTPVPRVSAKEHRLVQLFVNLLVNAAEAIEDGKEDENKIGVMLRGGETGHVRIEIEDTGRGIPTEDMAHIFEPFWTNKPGRMGLGLSVCHGIATALGGAIHAEQCEGGRGAGGRGTRFVVTLPTSDEKGTELTKAQEPRPPVARGKVLLIDDEERLATTLRLALSTNYDVDLATRGREALSKLRSGEYDVILCDLFLPDISGPDIYEEIERTRPHLAPRFVFLTGGAFTEKTRSFLQKMGHPRLEKPFDLSTLEALIAERLSAR